MPKESQAFSFNDTDANQAALRHSIRTQWLKLVLGLAILAGVFCYQSYTAHREITNQEKQRLQTQARVIASNIERQLEAANLALASVIKDMPYLNRNGNLQLTNRRLLALSDAMPGIRTLFVLDAGGTIVASNREELIGRSFRTRDYFATPARDNNPSKFYISPPFKTVLGSFLINVSRVIAASDGTFNGVVSAALDPDYFRVLLNSVLYAPDMYSAINHGDGIRFMIVPDLDGQPGKNLALPGTFYTRHRASGRHESVLTGKSPSYSTERIMALHTVQPQKLMMDKPLYVACSRDYSTIYESWRGNNLKLAFAFALIGFSSGAGLTLLQRRQKGLALLAERSQELVKLRLCLMEYAVKHDMRNLLNHALDEVCRQVYSPVGFYHFIEPDQQTISLQVWSTRTLDEFCTAKGHGLHYPIEQAGVWADCIRQRKPLVHNDYNTLPNRKGLPEGHAPVIRELVVPIIRSERVVAILGVGNKAEDYTDQDTELVSLLADIIWEITERKQSEDERIRLGQRYQTLLSVSSDGICILDQDGNLVESNPAFRKMLGYTADDDPRLNVRDWVDGILPEELTAMVRELIHAPAIFETKHRRRDGSVFDAEVNVSGVQLDGTWYLYASSRDISKRKEMEANLVRSNHELELFAYAASHDLQEPLRKIAGFTELLANRYKGTFDEKAESYMAYIIDGALRMRSLINDLLSYSRVMRSDRELVETDCSAVVQRVIRDLGLSIRECDAEIVCGTLPVILADKTQLGRLFQNLISNAIKYRGSDSPRINIDAVQQRDNWLFSVADNGIGIAQEFYERIFVIFQRLHTRTEYPGTGIGLAVCQKIVERHGGKIWVESTVGTGSTFYFTIPIYTPLNSKRSEMVT